MPRQSRSNRQIGITESSLDSLAKIAAPLLSGKMQRNLGQRPNAARTGSSLEFLEHREYRVGDDSRHINWRLSSGRSTPITRHFQDENSSEWMILLDISSSMSTPDMDKWYFATDIACALIFLLGRLGNRVGCCIFDNQSRFYQPPCSGRRQLLELVNQVSALLPKPQQAGTDLSVCEHYLPRRCPVFIISDFLVPQYNDTTLLRLKRMGHDLHTIQVLSENETTPPSFQTATLLDAETGISIPFDREQNNAKKLLDDHNSQLKDFCIRHQIPLTTGYGNDAWQNLLLRHLQNLNTTQAL